MNLNVQVNQLQNYNLNTEGAPQMKCRNNPVAILHFKINAVF